MEFKIDLNTLLRSLFPAVLVTALFFFYDLIDGTYITFFNTINSALKTNPFGYAGYAVFIIAGSIVFYAFYRTILYMIVIRSMQKYCKYMKTEMFEFHKTVIEEVSEEIDKEERRKVKKLKSIPVMEGCTYRILNTCCNEPQTSMITFNAFVHVLFMTAIILLIFTITDLVLSECVHWTLNIWVFVASVLTFAGGVAADKEADMRITVLLHKHRREYKRAITEFM